MIVRLTSSSGLSGVLRSPSYLPLTPFTDALHDTNGRLTNRWIRVRNETEDFLMGPEYSAQGGGKRSMT